jgi:hypothetical protein
MQGGPRNEGGVATAGHLQVPRSTVPVPGTVPCTVPQYCPCLYLETLNASIGDHRLGNRTFLLFAFVLFVL